ncbi:MAG: thioredoxin family protein [Pseudomonadota bacterium]
MPRIRVALILLVSFVLAPLAYAVDVPALTDLRADLAQMQERRLPMVLLVHAPGCGYCHYVIEDHLEPMILSGKYVDRALIRQLAADDADDLVDASGRAVSARAFARSLGVRFYPTVIFLGPDGRMLAEPLVGVANIDLYGTQLESALQKAEASLR